MRIVVERHPGNFVEVNKLFNEIYHTKKYVGWGKSRHHHSDFLHYPPLAYGKFKGKVVLKFKNPYSTLLTIEQAREKILGKT